MVFCDGCFVPSRSVASPHHQTTERRSKIHFNLVMSLWHSFILSPCHNDIPSCRFGAATERQYAMPQKIATIVLSIHESLIYVFPSASCVFNSFRAIIGCLFLGGVTPTAEKLCRISIHWVPPGRFRCGQHELLFVNIN